MTTQTVSDYVDRPAAPRRELATRKTAWARASARWLARAHVRPNSVSLASVAFAAGGCAAFAVVPVMNGSWRAVTLVLAAVSIQLRLLCNLLDGMIAVEEGFKTRTGEIYNDAPDRVADVLLLVGAGYALAGVPGGLTWGWLAAVLAVFTAYVRLLGGTVGANQSFIGPMAKQHRMFTLTIAALCAAAESLLTGSRWALWLGLVLIVAGSIVTAARRLRRILVEVEAR
jgi:phosphatidylglycerophosphate synthase